MHVTATGTASRRLLAPGQYCVVEIYARYSEVPRMRVEDDDGIPVLLAATDLVIVESAVPKHWHAELSEWAMILGPKEWREPGFWERFFDGEPAAVQLYEAHRCGCRSKSA